MKNNIDIEELRLFIINDIMRNPNIMFSDAIRGDEDAQDIDLVGVIVGMYEIIHKLTYNKKYDYMFHWANKCGSWVDTDYLKDIIDKREGRNE